MLLILPRRLSHQYSKVSLAFQTTSRNSGSYLVFDRNGKRLQKDRAASRNNGQSSRRVDYIKHEIAERLMERFSDIKRNFSAVMEIGAGSGHFTRLLEPSQAQKVLMLDLSEESLYRDRMEEFKVEVERKQFDEENLASSIRSNSQEAIVSCLALHWVNDLPGVLSQIREALKPDGVFIGALCGGDTLFELRTALQLTGIDLRGRIFPHISPMTDSRDISSLMGRAGFTFLTVDTEEVKVLYPSMWELINDLRDMGENNAVLKRHHFIGRDVLVAASAVYKELYGSEDNYVPATFQVIFLIGWKPCAIQT